MKAGIYFKVEVKTLGHIPRVVIILRPIITIHFTSCHFLFFKERVLVELSHLNFHIVILVLILPFHVFSTIF